MRTRVNRWILYACLLALAHPTAVRPAAAEQQAAGPWTAVEPAEAEAGAEARATAAMSELPMCFELNVGQTDEQVAFLARGSGLGVFLTGDALVLSLRRAAPERKIEEGRPVRPEFEREPAPAPAVVRMRLVGASGSAPVGELLLETRSNYFVGSDPARWRTDVPNFGRVRYREVYPGVDLVYYGRGGRLEYDFVVAPGADPGAAAMRFEGADGVAVDEGGELVVRVGDLTLRQRAPALYQEAEGGRRQVSGGYVLRAEGEVGFAVGGYDVRAPLVIDPVLVYSTYLGGSDSDQGNGIAVDSSGSAYVSGTTYSANFPTLNPYQSDRPDGDAYVAKLSVSGNALEYSTYLGGGAADSAAEIAVDASGNAYVAGWTESTDFPALHPYQTDQPGQDAFVAKLGPAGNALAYSTYLGGGDLDGAWYIAVDGSGSAYVSGTTWSTDFPTVNPYQTDQPLFDGFVTKLGGFSSVTGNLVLAYSTYLGGDAGDYGGDIAVDESGHAYLAASTASTDFPTVNPYQTDQPDWDAYVTKLSASGNALEYSTYLGGSGLDSASGVAIDASGYAYVAGDTSSSDFPTKHPYQTDRPGQDAFVAKLGPAGNALSYSTYLGGNDIDWGVSIAVDASHSFYVTGTTTSTNFPTKNAYQTDRPGWDVYVTKLAGFSRVTGNMVLAYSTYLGGNGDDHAAAIAVDGSGQAYVTGLTYSADFPTLNPYQPNQPYGDAFVTKLSAS